MVLLKSVQQNCSFAHPENVLLTMLGDSDKTIRSKAVRIIIKKSPRSSTNSMVRDFHLPKVDMDAERYQQLATITEVGCSKVLYLSQYKGLFDVTLLLEKRPGLAKTMKSPERLLTRK